MFGGLFAILALAIQLGLIIFVIWAVLSIVDSLQRIARATEERNKLEKGRAMSEWKDPPAGPRDSVDDSH